MLEMQRRSEAQFVALKGAEQEVIRLQGMRPQPFVRPARPALILRLLMRLLPPIARFWHLRIVRQSGLFDARWYLETYPDVKAAGADPALHFLRFGAAEERDPGPGFSTRHYMRLYPDVKAAGLNPLVHYMIAGWDEKRSIHPLMPEGQA
ncbi:hypothetical protein [Pseudotabrizicola algicola]|uniref:Uncharacterized protein n=1 Tax=Pseudotabrizicola algicola TaxID=2709381 RepID=A0A6B3RU93_9RHOB|nr:hypothetical protein [Pseudotabrizicola algicola]NEX46602.1 hypothetical protein [Pseudotabrizicola algicola]